MSISGSYLAYRFRTFALPCFRAYRDSVLTDVLPGYASIGERAERVADEAYEHLLSRPALDWDDDLSEAAEVATERGQLFYEMMTGMRQATINLHAAGLFHLLEQQLATLIHQVRDSTHPAERRPAPESHLQGYVDWIRTNMELPLRAAPQWSEVEELQVVANTVKHAEGRSERELRKRRPDLFVHPLAAETGLSGAAGFIEPLRLPLSGDGLFVTEKVFGTYAAAVYDFMTAILGHLRRNRKTVYPIHI